MTIKIIAFLLSLIGIFIVVIRVAIKKRDRGDDRLSVFEHPSVFKKPDIEMVNKAPEKDEVSGTPYDAGQKPSSD